MNMGFVISKVGRKEVIFGGNGKLGTRTKKLCFVIIVWGNLSILDLGGLLD